MRSTLPVTAAFVAALKPDYRSSFEVRSAAIIGTRRRLARLRAAATPVGQHIGLADRDPAKQGAGGGDPDFLRRDPAPRRKVAVERAAPILIAATCRAKRVAAPSATMPR